MAHNVVCSFTLFCLLTPTLITKKTPLASCAFDKLNERSNEYSANQNRAWRTHDFWNVTPLPLHHIPSNRQQDGENRGLRQEMPKARHTEPHDVRLGRVLHRVYWAVFVITWYAVGGSKRVLWTIKHGGKPVGRQSRAESTEHHEKR